MASQLLTVEKDGAVHVHAFKLQDQALIPIFLRAEQDLLIDIVAAGIEARVAAVFQLFDPLAVDHGVVGQMDFLRILFFAFGPVCPIRVEIDLFHCSASVKYFCPYYLMWSFVEQSPVFSGLYSSQHSKINCRFLSKGKRRNRDSSIPCASLSIRPF